jgi:hypothetical protein
MCFSKYFNAQLAESADAEVMDVEGWLQSRQEKMTDKGMEAKH